MTVAVQKGHETLKEELRNSGYDVVTYGEYNGIIDALLYADSLQSDGFSDSHFAMSSAGMIGENPKGILMINITNKSIQEIKTILQRRVYSPLF